TFTLYLPATYVGPSVEHQAFTDRKAFSAISSLQRGSVKTVESVIEQVEDDRADLQPDDAVLLIVEDDPHYAHILRDLARDKGVRAVVAHRGTPALPLARECHPPVVSLDFFLPDMLGRTVLNTLKQDPSTRHIPIQMLTLDEDRQHGLTRGAFAFVTKPTSPEALDTALQRLKDYTAPRRKRLLVIEAKAAEQR